MKSLTDRLREAVAWDEKKISPLRGLCTTPTDIMLWNDGGLTHAIAIKPIINQLIECVDALSAIGSGYLPNGDHCEGAACEFAWDQLATLEKLLAPKDGDADE